jgi:hypothetical protein
LALAVLAGVAVLIALAMAGLAYVDHSLSSSGRAFDARDWSAWGGERSCDSESPRLEMVEDLRASRLKLGMGRAAVIRLLGPGIHRFPRSLEYGLGGTIDCEFLALDFDQRGNLKRIERYQG